MPFSEVENIGTPEDMQRRQELLRVDDAAQRQTIESARALIFNKCHAVTSDDVEGLLKDKSLTPTAVSKLRLFLVTQTHHMLGRRRTHFHEDWHNMALTSTRPLW